jgi:hypothetical protein
VSGSKNETTFFLGVMFSEAIWAEKKPIRVKAVNDQRKEPALAGIDALRTSIILKMSKY